MEERIKKIVETLNPVDKAVVRALFDESTWSDVVKKLVGLAEQLPEETNLKALLGIESDPKDPNEVGHGGGYAVNGDESAEPGTESVTIDPDQDYFI